MALLLGITSGLLALALLRLISFFTNLFFYQRFSVHNASPAGNDLGVLLLAVPVLGSLVVGLMARYGSDKIRGHGIPEAIEAILINGSRIEPKVAVLKPLSAAIAIGSGGPFGAEGPIIMTGGSFGSFVAQMLHLSDMERKTLLVAGAAGGMSATFAAPVASVLLAVELLLFEWKPRSLIPVAIASLTAMSVRYYLLGSGPVFPIPAHALDVRPIVLLAAAAVGVTGGVLSAVLTSMVYGAEDGFSKLPIHWMWWPLLGGAVIGLGGLFVPRALGVGYDTIGSLLSQDLALKTMLGILVVKAIIWSISLGSGTSGGVLAPLLMMGAALGGLESGLLPAEAAGFWPMVGMAAVLGGSMRAPLTATVFALELTHDTNMFTPVLCGVIVSYSLSVLVMKRSILTEKVSRRGHHLTGEYSVDPLELHFVWEAMQSPYCLPLTPTGEQIREALRAEQDSFVLTEASGRVAGVVSRRTLVDAVMSEAGWNAAAGVPAVTAQALETLRQAANRMARTGTTALAVVGDEGDELVVGILSLRDLLKAYQQNMDREEVRRRHISFRLPLRQAAEPQ